MYDEQRTGHCATNIATCRFNSGRVAGAISLPAICPISEIFLWTLFPGSGRIGPATRTWATSISPGENATPTMVVEGQKAPMTYAFQQGRFLDEFRQKIGKIGKKGHGIECDTAAGTSAPWRRAGEKPGLGKSLRRGSTSRHRDAECRTPAQIDQPRFTRQSRIASDSSFFNAESEASPLSVTF